jgi:hypothetical protein
VYRLLEGADSSREALLARARVRFVDLGPMLRLLKIFEEKFDEKIGVLRKILLVYEKWTITLNFKKNANFLAQNW